MSWLLKPLKKKKVARGAKKKCDIRQARGNRGFWGGVTRGNLIRQIYKLTRQIDEVSLSIDLISREVGLRKL